MAGLFINQPLYLDDPFFELPIGQSKHIIQNKDLIIHVLLGLCLCPKLMQKLIIGNFVSHVVLGQINVHWLMFPSVSSMWVLFFKNVKIKGIYRFNHLPHTGAFQFL